MVLARFFPVDALHGFGGLFPGKEREGGVGLVSWHRFVRREGCAMVKEIDK